MIDRHRVHEDAYRWEVVETLMRDHGDAIMRFCVARLGEGLAVQHAYGEGKGEQQNTAGRHRAADPAVPART